MAKQQCFAIFLALRIPHNVLWTTSLKVSQNADPLVTTRDYDGKLEQSQTKHILKYATTFKSM